MTRRRVTLLDVGAPGRASPDTASFVLTGRRDMRISDEAEQRVLQAARELDYRPNLLARSLRTNLSQTIGMICDVVATEPFAGQMIRGSVITALRHDHLLFVGETQGDAEVEQHLVRGMLDRGVGGFLYAALYTREVNLSSLLRSQPLVLMNCVARQKTVPAVIADEFGGGRSAAQLLLDAGHRDGIVLVGETPGDVIAGAQRRKGIEAVLAEAGCELAGQVDTIWWPEPAFAATAALLSSGIRPTAFVCMNDRIALGVDQACREFGLHVPGDVSLISFDDSDLAAWSRPGLTSVSIPHLELGRRATELLLEPEPSPRVHRIEMPLTVRDSVGAPRGTG